MFYSTLQLNTEAADPLIPACCHLCLSTTTLSVSDKPLHLPEEKLSPLWLFVLAKVKLAVATSELVFFTACLTLMVHITFSSLKTWYFAWYQQNLHPICPKPGPWRVSPFFPNSNCSSQVIFLSCSQNSLSLYQSKPNIPVSLWHHLPLLYFSLWKYPDHSNLPIFHFLFRSKAK